VQTNAPQPSASAAVKEKQEEQGIIGEWIIPESGEALSITGSGQWFHPKHGRARLREAKDDADLKVYYTSSNAQCSYRVSFSDVGKTLNLTATDPTQDPDFCPSGRLRSLDRKR
jgi:hypothetical protein